MRQISLLVYTASIINALVMWGVLGLYKQIDIGGWKNWGRVSDWAARALPVE